MGYTYSEQDRLRALEIVRECLPGVLMSYQEWKQVEERLAVKLAEYRAHDTREAVQE